MHIRPYASRYLLVTSAMATVIMAPPSSATDIANGQTVTTQQQVTGTGTLNVAAGGTVRVNGTAVSVNSPATDVVITNNGTISSATNRAINANGATENVTLNNNAGAAITSFDDSFRVTGATAARVVVNNAGSISATGGGQALDLNDVVSNGTTASVTISNLATGSVTSTGADAVRPGAGGVLNNDGTIRSNDVHDSSSDGVDFQDAGGTVVNTGSISGARHGVTGGSGGGAAGSTSINVTNQLGGTITGRNGSGVGSDGNGTIVNFGTITGQWDGASTNGDGDGVDIDGIAAITNNGTIQGTSAHGVDKNGFANGSEGIAAGGGTIVNNAGAIISGAGTAILVDDGSGGSGVGVTTLTNAGTITGLGGPAIKLVGAFNDSITNSGTITGTGGTAIDMGAGDDTLTLLPGSVINGLADGGAGNNLLVLGGGGTAATLAGTFANFQQLSIAGDWIVNAQLANIAATVGNGGILRGAGGFGSLVVQSGGTVAPGGTSSIGTISVNGALTQMTGSTYLAKVGTSGLSDKIVVGGSATIQSGTTLALQSTGTLTAGSRYVVLTAASVTGSYTSVTGGTSTLELREINTGTSIAVEVARTGASLAGVALTPNQAGVARAFGGLTVANSAYAAITLLPNDEGVRTALDQMAGQMHASVRSATVRDAQDVQRAVIGHMDDPATNRGLWGQFTIGSGEDKGGFGIANDRRATRGGIGGIDIAATPTLRAGIAGGYNYDHLSVGEAADRAAKLKTANVMGYLAGAIGGVKLRAGVGYAWVDVSTNRSVQFPGFFDHLTAGYDARVLHGFGEAGLPFPVGSGTVEPFAGASYYHVSTDAFQEAGGAAALRGDAKGDHVFVSTVGMRVSTPITNGLFARAKAAWNHAFDNAVGETGMRFAAGGPGYTVLGTPLSRNAATVSAALAWQMASRIGFVIGYDGEIGSRSSQNIGRATLSVGF